MYEALQNNLLIILAYAPPLVHMQVLIDFVQLLRDFRIGGMDTTLRKLIFHIILDLVYFGGKETLLIN